MPRRPNTKAKVKDRAKTKVVNREPAPNQLEHDALEFDVPLASWRGDVSVKAFAVLALKEKGPQGKLDADKIESGTLEVKQLRRSLDARRKRIAFHITAELRQPGEPEPLGLPHPRPLTGEPLVTIIGDGPAGLFCAYELARLGVRSRVLDRGKMVQPRRHDLKAIQQHRTVNSDSNYCFGEGGAGTYSDGKLYTRSHKRGPIRDVIEVLALHGAPEEILVDARPHIGSNNLPKVIAAIRQRLESVGVVFQFESKVVDLGIRENKVKYVETASGERFDAQQVVIATGHSAKDVFHMAARLGLAMEAKPFAVGVRIEHPQILVNNAQYGALASDPRLPNAAYRLRTNVEERGVFSFCMCPGGWIIPASTEAGALVVNGMSLSRRDSPFANSGLVVSIELEDLERAGFKGPLAALEYQSQLEAAAWSASSEPLRAPATRVSDFLAKKASSTVPKSSYVPGLSPTNLAEVLDSSPSIRVSEKLRNGLGIFATQMKGYDSSDGVLVGVESRTSSPVRLLRDRETYCSPVAGLYPCGEGAGYAGGIVSAAVDGIMVARAIAKARAEVPR